MSSRRTPTIVWLLLAIIVVAGFAVRFADLNRQGETWDEIAYFNAGKQYAYNIHHLDFNPDHWDSNFEHPSVGKLIYAAASVNAYRKNVTDYTPGRVASTIMGMLTVLLVFLIGRRLVNDRVGLIAAVTLAFMPCFIAYNLVLGLDTPTALMFTLTAWVFIEAMLRRNHWLYLLAAVAAGLAIGTRLSNLLVLPTILAMWVIWRWPFKQGAKGSTSTGFSRAELWHVLTFATVPFVALVALWPWLWGSSWQNHLNQTIGHWSAIQVVFLGHVQVAPVSYYLVYLLAVIPGLILFALGWFLWRTVRTARRERLLVLAWLVIPFSFSFFGTRQGGLRYLLAIVPAIALATGFVLDELMVKMRRSSQWVLAGTLVCYLLVGVSAVRPYYLDCYNEFTGGPKVVAANRTFQIGWWNEGVDASVLWLNGHAESNAKVAFLAVPERSQHLLRADLQQVDVSQSTYAIVNPSYLWYNSAPAALGGFSSVHEEQALGASVASVLKR